MANFKLINQATIAAIALVVSSCSLLQKSPDGSSPEQAILLDTLDFEITADAVTPYQPSPTIVADIKHLELNLSFDLPEKKVLGKARIKISAYSLPIDTVVLDAKGFTIDKISIEQNDSIYFPDYSYDNKQITLPLLFSLSKKQLAKIEIDYVASPTDIITEDGNAIQSNQGLYFINPKGNLEGKPTQIWSQGEPESNSTWFPSIDKPHEKFTQEIFLTVDSTYKTISNGKLIYTTFNNDGTRTDYWKQDLEHSNYLVMIALGEFTEVKDKWKNLDVFYYVDEEYAPYAFDIFGNTPEMLSFFSDTLNFEYPWAKYHQVVVKDFVSGAMENTSAVIHGDFLQQTKRELIDENHEDVIAHELFHHWFGDIVTCETWSQITLNEGFATYGEFLWNAYKYGDETARYFFSKDLKAYLGEAKSTPKHMNREHYNNIDDVFDSHSYQKGGRILHMLRLEVGDALFFESISNYLHQFQYKTAEIEDLRLVFERTTGRDLKWFFNQWYQEVGHPKMDIDISYSDSTKQLQVVFTQTQPLDWPIFKLHVPITYATSTGNETKTVFIEEAFEVFNFPLENKPAWVSVDPNGDMLWEKNEQKDSLMLMNELQFGPSFLARNNALISLYRQYSSNQNEYSAISISDEFWATRALSLSAINPEAASEELKNRVLKMAQNDENSTVRAQALNTLDTMYRSDSTFTETFVNALSDSSFLVIKYGILGLNNRNPCLAAEKCEAFESLTEGNLSRYITKAYSDCGDEKYLPYFTKVAAEAKGVDAFVINADFAKYAQKNGTETGYDALVKGLSNTALYGDSWYARYSALQGLETAQKFYESKLTKLQKQTEQTTDDVEAIARIRSKKANLSALIDEAKELNSEGDGVLFRD
ncbi:MAG: M1 family metallopeptidase [Salibacteraceae bacterium]|nr:M1 family metallopeptidase [Salibacteraceae bacterium]MDP4763944.1 M1 family metallopeptidase [Salibacteraceae bacterium]MDP4843610.1 M1 family metallopeptidase [Salibacteraceae bacterium]MDP4964583.1 M1 family metallopeptidase [Salibacteraceae bacterium]